MNFRSDRPGTDIFAVLLAGWALFGAAGATVAKARPVAERSYRLKAVSFADLPGFSADRLGQAWRVFVKSCATQRFSAAAISRLRPAAWKKICAAALRGEGERNPRAFFKSRFQPYLIVANPAGDAYFTAYYQPEIPGSLARSPDFPVPVYAFPPDLTRIPKSERVGALAGLTAARRNPDGRLSPYPDRAAIEDGALKRVPGVKKLVYLRDKADLFLAQVQGSARVRLRDGRILHLAFAGRNGQPYVSLARVLVLRGVAPAADMTMARLLAWLRQNGLKRGEAGDDLLRLDRSYIFFSARIDRRRNEQPRGASRASLTPLRSIAIDAHIWPYGLPFYIDASLPWRGDNLEPFQRLMIAQDTGSAIVGPARADIFFGCGDAAGARAGEIRHHGRFFLLLPKD